jgi:hypothetical protein
LIVVAAEFEIVTVWPPDVVCTSSTDGGTSAAAAVSSGREE